MKIILHCFFCISKF